MAYAERIRSRVSNKSGFYLRAIVSPLIMRNSAQFSAIPGNSLNFNAIPLNSSQFNVFQRNSLKF